MLLMFIKKHTRLHGAIYWHRQRMPDLISDRIVDVWLAQTQLLSTLVE